MFNGAFDLEPPTKRFKGDGRANGVGKGVRSTGEPQEEGEVRFRHPEAAQRAVQTLNQSIYLDKQISVALDHMSPDGTKIVVTNMPAGIAWQELKDHFGQVGEVHYANIGRTADILGGKGFGVAEPGKPCVGEVRYNTREEATQAMQMFDGQLFKGAQLRVKPDLSSSRQTKVLVFNVTVGTEWTELRALFEQAGPVLFCGIDCAVNKGKGKGKLPFDGGVAAIEYAPPPPPMLTAGASQWDVMPQDLGGQVGAASSSDTAGAPHPAPVVIEVRFINAAHAMQAITLLNGSRVGVHTISVVQDGSCRDGSRVLVFGAEDTPLPSIKEHFDQAGQVAYCGWKGAGKGKGITSFDAVAPAPGQPSYEWQDPASASMVAVSPAEHYAAAAEPAAPLVGEVRYADAALAHQACQSLSGSQMGGHTITVVPDGGCKDGSRVLVLNVPPEFPRHSMKEYFEQVGRVEFAGWKGKGNKGFGKGFEVGYAAAVNPMHMAGGYSGSPAALPAAAPAGAGGMPPFAGTPQPAFSQAMPSTAPAPLGAPMGASGAAFSDPIGSGPPPGAPVVGEVRFVNAEMAQQAILSLNQTLLAGTTISVVRDGGCRDGSRVLVFGLQPDAPLHLIRDHFDQAGQVSYCGWKGGGKGIGKSYLGKKGFSAYGGFVQ